jgi:hypothetical protein
MERKPEQAIIGQFSLWISDVNPKRSYWLLVLTNHGIYDAENSKIQKLLQKHGETPLSRIVSGASILSPSKTRLDATLDFFLWLYTEDEAICFEVMKRVYDDFHNDEDVPEPDSTVKKLEEFDPSDSGHYPDISDEELVSLSTQVVGEGGEFAFYRYVADHIADAQDEVFLIDPYVDKEAIRLYLADIPAGVEKRILTAEPQGNFDSVVRKFVQETDHRVEVRATPKCHDRLLFVDDHCFLVGISIKDAGRNPTYVADFKAVGRFRDPWEELWDEADIYRIFE